ALPRHAAYWRRISVAAVAGEIAATSELSGIRSTAPVRSRFMFCSNARGLAWKIANIQLCASGETSFTPATPEAIDDRVSPRCTRCVEPAPWSAAGGGGATVRAPFFRPLVAEPTEDSLAAAGGAAASLPGVGVGA